jgi:hypothetical protein
MHTLHHDVHDYGLADECDGCAEHAEKPFSNLDEWALRDLVERTLRNRFARPFGEVVHPRSNAEARAMAVVMTLLEQVGRLAEVAPAPLGLYLRERWKVPCTIEARPMTQAERDLRERFEPRARS